MTAVEWLIEQFRITNSYSYISETFKQAKEMEKQQIVDAHLTGLIYPLEMEASVQA
jgi:acid stress-induced BolA-like protein IbaG/YrbA